MDLNAKVTPLGLALAAAGTVAGMALGSYLRPKVEARIRARRFSKDMQRAMKNPTIVPNVPGSPIDIATKRYQK